MKNNSDHHDRNVRGEKTRSDILAAAYAVFSELGPDAASLRYVARRAGVNIATLMYYFPNKENLFNEAINAMDDSEIRIVTSWRARISDEDLSSIDNLKKSLRDLGIKIINRIIDDPSRFRFGVFTALEPSFLTTSLDVNEEDNDLHENDNGDTVTGVSFTSTSPEKEVVREVLYKAVELGTLHCDLEELEDYIEGFTHLTQGFAIEHIKEFALNSANHDETIRRFRKMVTRYIENMLPHNKEQA